MTDLISKSALNEAMYHEAFETDSDMQKWDSGCWIRYKMFENALASAPTIEPKRGKWIYDKGLYRCTACNNLLTVAGWDIPEEQIYKSFKFCPNCGAKMERSEE